MADPIKSSARVREVLSKILSKVALDGETNYQKLLSTISTGRLYQDDFVKSQVRDPMCYLKAAHGTDQKCTD